MTLMNAAEHTMATDLEWDPTGRYVVTTVSYWSQKVCTRSVASYQYILTVCSCVCVCVTEVGCSWGGTRLVMHDLCASIY